MLLVAVLIIVTAKNLPQSNANAGRNTCAAQCGNRPTTNDKTLLDQRPAVSILLFRSNDNRRSNAVSRFER